MARKHKSGAPTEPGGALRQLNIKIPAKTAAQLEELTEFRNLSKSAVVREAIEDSHTRFLQRSIAPRELSFLGDAHTVALKWKAVEMCRWRKGPAMIAKELDLTRKTVLAWRESDPLFNEMCQDAWDYTSELEVHTLFRKGQDDAFKGQLTAIFGGLNNLNPDFGFVRRDYLDAHDKELEEAFLASVRPYVSRDVLQQIAADYARRLTAKAGP